jgi:hypothetical protein
LRSHAHARAKNIHAFVIERLRALIVELPIMKRTIARYCPLIEAEPLKGAGSIENEEQTNV